MLEYGDLPDQNNSQSFHLCGCEFIDLKGGVEGGAIIFFLYRLLNFLCPAYQKTNYTQSNEKQECEGSTVIFVNEEEWLLKIFGVRY